MQEIIHICRGNYRELRLSIPCTKFRQILALISCFATSATCCETFRLVAQPGC